jgi:hypothetical protein
MTLKTEIRKVDDCTTIVISYVEDYIGHYRATVRYITTRKCLTVDTKTNYTYDGIVKAADKIAKEMLNDHDQHAGDCNV